METQKYRNFRTAEFYNGIALAGVVFEQKGRFVEAGAVFEQKGGKYEGKTIHGESIGRQMHINLAGFLKCGGITR